VSVVRRTRRFVKRFPPSRQRFRIAISFATDAQRGVDVSESNDAIEGSCVCGAVHYSYAPPARNFQYCHCSRCRKGSGSAHAANVFVTPSQFTWLKGEDAVKRFELPTAKYWSRAFCTTCGSAMPWLTRSGKSMVIPAGGLDDDAPDRPQRNIYFGSRAQWYVPAADLEAFDTYPQ
jgi:hypothetical protein